VSKGPNFLRQFEFKAGLKDVVVRKRRGMDN
jgi:hypothetical protein